MGSAGSLSSCSDAGIIPVSVVASENLRLKVKITDEKGQSENYLMLLNVKKREDVTTDYVLRCAERLYAARTGNSTTLQELVTDDNFQFPKGESIVEYLRDSDKLTARAAKATPVAKPVAVPAVPLAEKAGNQGAVKSTSVVPTFFCSYCWKNSKNAEEENEIEAAVGVADPRHIQEELKHTGKLGWLDKEQLGKAGLFNQLCSALLSARAVVAFISDEYAKSDNCNMELLYAAKTLRLPIIPVVVGAGMDWLKTQVGLVLAGALWIDMRNEEKLEDAMEQLQSRLNQIVGDDVDEEAYKKIVNVAEPDNPEIDDSFEVLCHYSEVGNLNFDSSFSQEDMYYRKTGKSSQGGPSSLLSDYWWPVTITDVVGNRVKVKYASYEDWDEDASWFNKSQLRSVQYATVKIDHATLIGKKVEARLHQNGSYCWAAGVVKKLLPEERCLVEFPVVEPTAFALERVLTSRDSGTKLDDVLVNAANVTLAQLRLL